MRSMTIPIMGVIAAAVLGGCQVQHTTVLEASSTNGGGGGMPVYVPVRRPASPRSPCTAPAGSGPYEHLSNPIYNPEMALPDRALAAHVNGCAGVRFRLGEDGVPRDVTLVTEYPLGYGFGQRALDKVSAMRWEPKDDLSWRFLVINQVQPSAG